MNKEQALSILEKYSPMPDEEDLTEEMIGEYASTIEYFGENPDSICIEPYYDDVQFGRLFWGI
ncbi:hypothetical protein [Peribacillus asahii]|uniref:hypothetical protein n=1 Tax=Peribacillus asahii TaxID=228899 RepID=UPI00207A9748|nr:hypothetical protein [Peribacillus asahii]USK61771.1 hypothetical protein LIT37_10890 [Peribacillus asahii]